MALVPVTAMLEIERAVLPELLKVTLCGDEAVPMVSLPKLRLVMESVAVGPPGEAEDEL